MLILKKPGDLTLDILHDLLKESSGKFAYELKFISYFIMYEDDSLPTSYIIFLNSIVDFKELEDAYHPERYQNKFIKFFVFIENLTYMELKSSQLLRNYNGIAFLSNKILHHTYFITNEKGTITLSSAEWFHPSRCNLPTLVKLNTFHKRTEQWESKLINFNKFMNYNGCKLIMNLPIPYGRVTGNFILNYVSGYSIPNKNLTNFKIYGLTPAIFEIASKFYNFSADYQPVSMTQEWLFNPDSNNIYPVEINRTLKISTVFFQLFSIHALNTHRLLRSSNVIIDLKVNMLVTPAEKYSPYEKFFLPFDLETWILLSVTFILTFLCIMIINHTSKSTQSLVYGHKVETPLWNVVSIFFGISQTKLPNKNFPRFILILFIYFCLIFRTCFQSKFFEFMTSEPRRSPPKTIDDLIKRNYNVYSQSENLELSGGNYRSEQWPKILQISSEDFREKFLTQSQNSSAKIALCTDEYVQNYIEKTTQKNYRWNQLNDPILYKTHEAFIFWSFSIYFPMLNKVINDLIPTGIMKYLVENHYTIKENFAVDDEGPKVLSMKDLLFGFKICCGFGLPSILSFIVELCAKSWNNPKMDKKIKFSKIYPLFGIADKSKCKLSLELIEVFRTKSSAEKETQDNFNFDLFFGGLIKERNEREIKEK